MILGPRRRISLFHNMKFASIPEKKQEEFHLNPNAPAFHMQMRPAPHHHLHHHPLIDGFQVQPAPWMMRRFEMAAPGFSFAPSVVRAPRGPMSGAEKNRSGGFQKWCRNRMEGGSSGVRKPGSRAVPIVAPPKDEEEEHNEGTEVKQEESDGRDEKVIVEVLDVEEESEKSR